MDSNYHLWYDSLPFFDLNLSLSYAFLFHAFSCTSFSVHHVSFPVHHVSFPVHPVQLAYFTLCFIQIGLFQHKFKLLHKSKFRSQQKAFFLPQFLHILHNYPGTGSLLTMYLHPQKVILCRQRQQKIYC